MTSPGTTDKAEFLTAGIHDGIPADRYHDDPCPEPSLSASLCKTLIKQSPKHAWLEHPRLGGAGRIEEHRHIFDIGEAAHALLLEGFDAIEVVDAKDWRTKAAKEWRDGARADGKIPLLPHEEMRVRAMVLDAQLQLRARKIKLDGKPEQTMVWQEDDGLWCRARIDMLCDNSGGKALVRDYKTTGASSRGDKWARTMYGLEGDVQAAFYLRGLRALDIEAEWQWLVQEVQPPYALTVCTLSSYGLELADRKVEHALGVWRRCMESGEWPTYPRGVYEIDPPAWEESAQLTRELADPAAVAAAIEMGTPL